MAERNRRNGATVRARHSISPDPEAWARAQQLATANSVSISQLFDLLVNEEWSRVADDSPPRTGPP